MLPRHVGRATLTGVDQRPQPGVRADHVVGAERDVQRRVHRVQQELRLLRSRLRHIGYRAGRVLVREPQIHTAQLFGHREHEAIDLAWDRNRQRGDRISERLGIEHEMRSATGTQADRGVHRPRPNAAGVDDGAGRYVERLPATLIGQRHRRARRIRRRDTGENRGSVLGGGPGNGRDQSGIVDQLTVVGEQTAGQPVASHRGREFDGAVRVDPPGSRQRRRRRACELAQPVTGHKAEPHQRPRRIVHRRQQRNQLRHGLDEVRGVARHQDSAFDRTAPRDADVARREVSQTAVHQLAAPAAGAEGKVVLLHQRDAQTPRRGVQCDADAGDAAADHDDVDRCRRRPAPRVRRLGVRR